MPSNHTVNFDLSQWERTDKVLMEDFNADNKKIDDALKEQADALAAEKNAREAAMSAEAGARKALSSSLDAAVARLGNCQLEYFTVSLNSVDGEPATIRFSAEPEIFFIIGNNYFLGSRYVNSLSRINSSESNMKVTWTGSSCKLAGGLNGVHNVFAFYRKDL